MIPTDCPGLALTLTLGNMLRRIVETGDAAARAATVVGLEYGQPYVQVEPAAWIAYRAATMMAGLASAGIPNGGPRNN